jgi:phosphoserine phosphatase RsbU/P
MSQQHSAPRGSGADRDLHEVVFADLRETHLRRDYLQGLKDLYQFYLDDERRARLEDMGRIRRAFSMLGWLFKSLLMKLSPARRLLILAAMILTVYGPTTSWRWGSVPMSLDLRPLGFVLLLIVLMLELRDKLLAKDEIAVARQVQLALLPRTHPEVPGWHVWSCSRPANDVGGDLVDYIAMDGFRHGVVLGDVSGKGLGAALLMAKLQATLRALVPASASLDELGSRANDILHRDGLDNRYATLFFAELQHHSGHLRYLNAGHNPPFVVRPDGIERLPPSSYPLGMLATANYAEGSAELARGDWLLAYSDGLSEACNAAGEEFGIGRLERLLPGLHTRAPEEIGARILKEVDAFVGPVRLSDDLSLAIIVRR